MLAFLCRPDPGAAKDAHRSPKEETRVAARDPGNKSTRGMNWVPMDLSEMESVDVLLQ